MWAVMARVRKGTRRLIHDSRGAGWEDEYWVITLTGEDSEVEAHQRQHDFEQHCLPGEAAWVRPYAERWT